MKKKICLALSLFILAAPLCAAAFFAFIEPAVNLHAPQNPAGPNREAYKPYPAPRGEVSMSQYNIDSRRQFVAIERAFEEAHEQIEFADKTAEAAVRDFDEIIVFNAARGKKLR